MADIRKSWDSQLFRRGSNGWTAKEQWDVIGTNNPADAAAALAAVGLVISADNPVKHPKSDLVYLESIDPQPAGFNRWLVDVSWSSSPRGFHPNPGNPLNDPAIYSWTIGNETVPIDIDAYGIPILTRAMTAFAQSATTLRTTLFFNIRRNEPVFNPALPLTYMNKVNSQPMLILGTWSVEPGQVICRTIRPLADASILSPYTPVEYAFELRAPFGSTVDNDGLWDSFKLRLLNESIQGWYVDGGNNTVLGTIGTWDSGNNAFTPSPTDVRLDQNGKPLDPQFTVAGNNPPVAAPGTFPIGYVQVEPSTFTDSLTGKPIAWFLKYTQYGPVDFRALNL